MKHLFLYLIIICNGFTLSAQNPFSVKFELVNPSGKIGTDSYFLFTLTNNTDSSYIFTQGVNRFGYAEHTYLVREIKFQTEISKGSPTWSFDFRDKKGIVLKPRQSLTIHLPKFIEGDGSGVLPYNKKLLHKVEKIRFILNLQYLNKDNPFAGLKTVDLVSNWLDVKTTELNRLKKKVKKYRIKVSKNKWKLIEK